MPQAQAAASALTSRKIALYGALSTTCASLVVLAAFRQRPNFYAAAVLLGRSNGCMLVLLNFGIFLALVLGKVCQRAFFGPLRDIEIEHLYERSWYAVTESLLAMTIFRDSFDSSFVILFGTLLFLKVFHWLSADRVEYMEQSPSVNRLFHVRMVSVLWTLLCLDLFLVAFATEVLILDKNRMGIMIMFASEFMILTATLLSTMAKYTINCHDLRSDEPWEAKSMYVFFVDLLTDFLKLVVYVSFFYLILTYYGFPLNMVRDVFFTARSFVMRIRHFFRYRAATRNMDSRFPDATVHDMRTGSDGTCIICRDEMVVTEPTAQGDADAAAAAAPPPPPRPAATGSGLNETPKKLPCGHIFHFHCLRSWLERQQSCPTCRRTVFVQEASGGTTANAAPGNAAPPPAAPGQGPAPAPNAAAAATPTVAAAPVAQAGGAAARPPPAPGRAAGIQGFLQQLHADAQRVRETARPATPTPPAQGDASAAGSSTLNAPPPTPTPTVTAPPASSSSLSSRSAASSRIPARPQIHRALIHSMFVNAPAANPAPGRSSAVPPLSTANASSGSPWNFPAPAAQAAPGTDGSTQTHWMPPPPWTLRGAMPLDSTLTASVQSDAAGASVERLENKVGEEQNKLDGEIPADPLDAREAARAAALRRFAALGQGSSKAESSTAPQASACSSSSTTATLGGEGRNSAAAAAAARNLPGNPHLIPLFDASLVPSSSSGTALPYPLLARSSKDAATSLAQPDVSLNAGLSALALPTGVSGAAVLASLDESSIASLGQRTRAALEDKLRVLGAVQHTVWETVDVLTRALSAMDDGAASASATAPATSGEPQHQHQQQQQQQQQLQSATEKVAESAASAEALTSARLRLLEQIAAREAALNARATNGEQQQSVTEREKRKSDDVAQQAAMKKARLLHAEFDAEIQLEPNVQATSGEQQEREDDVDDKFNSATWRELLQLMTLSRLERRAQAELAAKQQEEARTNDSTSPPPVVQGKGKGAAEGLNAPSQQQQQEDYMHDDTQSDFIPESSPSLSFGEQ